MSWGQRRDFSTVSVVSSIYPTSTTGHDFGHVFSWAEVSQIHRTRHGIYQTNGDLISLLTDFGKINPPYQDRYADGNTAISYTGSGRRGDQTLDPRNRALLAAIASGHSVPLFCKLGVNRWQYLGYWRVLEAEYVFDGLQQRMLWKFKLQFQERPNVMT